MAQAQHPSWAPCPLPVPETGVLLDQGVHTVPGIVLGTVASMISLNGESTTNIDEDNERKEGRVSADELLQYISAGQETDGEMLRSIVTTKEADCFTKSQRRSRPRNIN